jgi:hypothetical protein
MTKTSPFPVNEDPHAALAAELLDNPVLPRDMRLYPHVSHDVRRANAKFIGASGEYLVDSLLTRHGLTVWSAPDLHRADRLIAIHGRAVLMQIKTVTAPVNGSCVFTMVHGNGRAGSQRPYARDAFDIAALAVLSENVVKFVPNRGRSFHVDVAEFESLKADPIDSLEFSLSMMMKDASLPRC